MRDDPLCVPVVMLPHPKQTLAPASTYTVVASGMPKAGEFVWSFTTSAK